MMGISNTLYPLHVTIVGAGIGGLAAATALSQNGHHVQVLEALDQLSETGAGIQIAPNASRILDSWGLMPAFYEKSTKNDGTIIRRYSDGKAIGKIQGGAFALYHYHPLTLHRADYQKILYDAAVKAGAKIKFGTRINSIDISKPSLTLQDGSIIESDLIIGADGIGSKTRTAMFPSIQAQPTPDCAFRVVLTHEEVLADPNIAYLVENPSSTMWFGPHRHIVAYTIRGTDLYNIVFCGPGTASVGTWNEPACLDDLKEDYSAYEDTVKRLMGVAKTCHKWRIGVVPDLPSWLNGNGKLALLGDAAHAMMPYTAQGAASCIEDAAILAGCLSHATSPSSVFQLTKAYEYLRKPRAEKIKSVSEGNMGQYGLPDGPEQEARDEIYAKTLKLTSEIVEEMDLEVPKADINAKYGSPGFSSWIYGYDTEEVLRGYFEETAAKI